MKHKLLVMFLLLGVLSCVASAQNVYVNSSPTANFASFHTYAWGQGPNPNAVANSFLAQEAQKDINAALQAKGLTMVAETANPDLVVVISGGMKVQTSYSVYGMRMLGGGMGGITPEQNVAGTLVVDIYDAQGKELAWRGVASGTLNESNSSKNMKMVDNAVTKMFKKYPK